MHVLECYSIVQQLNNSEEASRLQGLFESKSPSAVVSAFRPPLTAAGLLLTDGWDPSGCPRAKFHLYDTKRIRTFPHGKPW